MIVEVAESNQVAGTRRAAVELARQHGFDDVREGRAALVATEMATNLVKHASNGKIVLSSYDDASGTGIELLSLDSGAGIADVNFSMQDGTSSSGTMGGGLGAIRRQSDIFDIFSRPGIGTAVVARIARTDQATADTAGAVVGSVFAPYPGEKVCGDGWAYGLADDGPTLMMIDGSGHGPQAEIVALAAASCFRENLNRSCVSLVTVIHRALAATRGGALAVARIDAAAKIVRYVGVGNIAGTMLADGGAKKMVSNNGIAGHVASTIREFTYPYTDPTATIVLHSDGLTNHWDIADYPGLAFGHPSAIAGFLFRDHVRGRDDVSVVVAKA